MASTIYCECRDAAHQDTVGEVKLIKSLAHDFGQLIPDTLAAQGKAIEGEMRIVCGLCLAAGHDLIG